MHLHVVKDDLDYNLALSNTLNINMRSVIDKRNLIMLKDEIY